MREMIRKVSRLIINLVQQFLPDAFVFCIILTALVFVLGMVLEKKSFFEMLDFWQQGLWGEKILSFALQMVLILTLGSAFAGAPLIKKILVKIASLPKTPSQSVILVSFVSGIIFWLNWGLGLIAGLVLAKTVAKKVKGLDYGLIMASVYGSISIWHGGLSGSIPLLIALKGHFLEDKIGVISTTQTIFSWQNLTLSLLLLVTIPFILAAMHPKEDEVKPAPELVLNEEEEKDKVKAKNFAEKLEQSQILSLIIAIGGLTYLLNYFFKGGDLNLNIVNFILLCLGLLLYPHPLAYIKSLYSAMSGVGGIVLQFPFYGGIMQMMAQSGLVATIASWFINISSVKTLPLFTYWSAGIVNMFIPSGGGQWMVQGPVMMEAASKLSANIPMVSMALGWGDAATNLIQPFWAIPIIALAKINLRDLMGYTATAFIYAFLVTSIFIYFFF